MFGIVLSGGITTVAAHSSRNKELGISEELLFLFVLLVRILVTSSSRAVGYDDLIDLPVHTQDLSD